ncbi:MAG: hypothetical protein IKN63_01100 [Bacilli bacterium]|nr:hypothetical protein [Bacilli bacterium]
MKYILTMAYLLCTTSGLTFMKLGGDSLHLTFKNGFNFKMGWFTFFGFCLYLISFLLWQRMLIKYDLSIMVPIVTGLVQIIVLVIGHFVFKENLSIISAIGAIMIVAGIVIMTIGK